MSKIITNSETNSKVGSSLSPSAKCPTKSEILATDKAEVIGLYSNNQCIQDANVSKKIETFKLTFRGTESDNYTVSQQSLPPTDPGPNYRIEIGGETLTLTEGQSFGYRNQEKFAFNKAIYVRKLTGQSYTVPVSSVTKNGTYTVG